MKRFVIKHCLVWNCILIGICAPCTVSCTKSSNQVDASTDTDSKSSEQESTDSATSTYTSSNKAPDSSTDSSSTSDSTTSSDTDAQHTRKLDWPFHRVFLNNPTDYVGLWRKEGTSYQLNADGSCLGFFEYYETSLVDGTNTRTLDFVDTDPCNWSVDAGILTMYYFDENEGASYSYPAIIHQGRLFLDDNQLYSSDAGAGAYADLKFQHEYVEYSQSDNTIEAAIDENGYSIFIHFNISASNYELQVTEKRWTITDGSQESPDDEIYTESGNVSIEGSLLYVTPANGERYCLGLILDNQLVLLTESEQTDINQFGYEKIQ